MEDKEEGEERNTERDEASRQWNRANVAARPQRHPKHAKNTRCIFRSQYSSRHQLILSEEFHAERMPICPRQFRRRRRCRCPTPFQNLRCLINI